jgi:hypothetical protein
VYVNRPQLGVDDGNAIINGMLANKSQFFGSSTAEVVSDADRYGGWNRAYSQSVSSSAPWSALGARSDNSSNAGILISYSYNGAANNNRSHRTILSGY